MRNKSAAVDADRVVLTEQPCIKYLELDGSEASADEADDAGDPWSPATSSASSSTSTSPAASPASPTTSTSWKERIAFNNSKNAARKRQDAVGAAKSGKKDKNEPSRFMGEGVSFKAKLIGILEVAEARGDRMCQDALADLKMAIRAAGEHKQRITINIAIDGLRLRDEKTGDCLYHHLVHKISFIAQDMTDPRAFGYIFGSPDTGHRFFGIKTDKAASQVVECIRDLFQVVFALKNREQHIEQQHVKVCGGSTSNLASATSSTPSVTYMEAMAHHLKESCVRENGSPGAAAASSSKAESEATIADLLDLEYELNSLHQNMEHMALGGSKDDVFGGDPFGDSFTSATTRTTTTRTSTTVAPLPPPPSAKDVTAGTGTHRRERTVNRANSTTSTTTATVSAAYTPTSSTFGAPSSAALGSAPPSANAPLAQEEKHWFDQETEALFDDAELSKTLSNASGSRLNQDCSRVSPLETFRQASLADQFDVFTELDPLGTGRSKPYVDKKDFFSDLKNPPKKVLKDLVGEPGCDLLTAASPAPAPAPSSAPLFQASFDSGSRDSAGPQTQAGALGDVLSALETAPGSSTSYPSFPDPFSDDPFDKTDPFAEGSFSQTVSFSPNTVIPDPFESGFADFSSFPPGSRNSASPLPSAALGGSGGTGAVHGPLRVSLPPEDGAAASSSCLSPSPPLTGSLSKQRSRFTRKQLSVSLVKIPSPKSSQRRSRLPKQMTVDGSPGVRFPTPPLDEAPPSSQRRSPGGLSRGVITPSPPIVASFPDLDGDAGSRLSGSSAELAEIAPEPPPRPAPNAFSIKPPPLPPKKHTGAIFKPPPRPPHQDDPHSIYDHIENYESSSSPTPHDLADAKSPPIPVPARKPRYGDDGSVPLRPKKQAVLAETEDGYLAPIPFLPPPVKRSSSQSQQRKAGHGHGQGQAASGPGKKSLDITLSQLTKTGFTDLASTLGISPSQLSRMTLQDLTKRLAGLSEPGAQQPAAQGDGFTAGNRHSLSKAEYTALRESVDEDSGFAAEFDDNFCNIGSAAAPSASAVNQESLYDKYAVFRELLLQDEPGGGLSSSELEETNLSTTQGESADSLQEEGPVDMGAPSSVPHSSPITISVVAQPDSPATSITTAMSSASASASASPSPAQALVDRYAALREISLCDESSNKDDDERDEDNNGYAEVENESDKDDSITEVIRDAMQVQDEDQDLLTLSAQHSESTESPTLDTNAVRDAPSIMETTILEEDGCTSEGDASERLADQAMPPLSKNSLLDSSIASLEPVPENLELASVSATLIPGLTNGSGVESGAVAAAPAAGAQPGDQSARPHSLEPNKSPGEAWAKFDSSHFEKPVSDEGASPWSSDGKEFGGKVTGWKDDSDHERRDRGRRRRPNRGHGPASASTAGPPSGPPGPGPAAWAEDEESEEGWDDRVSDDLWENGFEEGQGRGRYPEPRRSRRRKVSPWRRGSSRDREASPWESGDSAGPPPPGQEDMKRSWKTRPKNRGSSWEEERMQRGGGPGSTGPGSVGGPGSTRGSWDGDGSEYEDARKRRQSPWGEDRDRDRERRHAWEEDERYRREGWEWYYRDRDRDHRGDHRDDDYRRRWEYERDRERGRDRDWDYDRYGRPRKGGPPPHYRDRDRDRDRDSPWDDELSEQGDDDGHGPPGPLGHGPHGPHGPHGSHSSLSHSRKWRRSRPGSAASRGHERVSPSTSVEYKEDDSPGPPGGSAGQRRRGYRDHGEHWDRERDRDRDRMGGSMDRRSRSRDDPFSSDQEHDYWERDRERGERTRSRTERDARYEQRSQTLYARRANRSRYKTYDTPSPSVSFTAKQSPFEDDFSSQRFDFVSEAKPSSTSFSQESSLDASDPSRSPLPASLPHVQLPHKSGHPAAPGHRGLRDSLSESEEAQAQAGGAPGHGHAGVSLSPLERGRGRASPMGSSRRQSPFEDDFTPPNSANARHLSSASSDVSDQHRFALDEAPSGGGSRPGSRPGSGRKPQAPPVDADLRSNGRSVDDVFLPAESNPADAVPAGVSPVPGHGASGAGPEGAGGAHDPVISPNRPSSEHRRSVRISGEDKNLAGMKARLANLRRTDSSSSLRKSESINIFARSCDPFDDDDFFALEGSAPGHPQAQPPPPHPGRGDYGQNPGAGGRPSGDQYKWTEAFDSFNFEEEH